MNAQESACLQGYAALVMAEAQVEFHPPYAVPHVSLAGGGHEGVRDGYPDNREDDGHHCEDENEGPITVEKCPGTVDNAKAAYDGRRHVAPCHWRASSSSGGMTQHCPCSETCWVREHIVFIH